MSHPEWTRVRDKLTGHQYSVRNVNPDKHEVLKGKDATDRRGRPLAAKPKVDIAVVSGRYDSQRVDELKAEIEARNAGRDEADQIPATGNKPDLIAALVADDTKE